MRLCVIALLLVLAAPAGAQPEAEACYAAILAAEAEQQLPPALLGAIARVESGRALPGGGIAPWPWTINAEGQGRFFASQAEAVAAVQALLARGVRLIDIGCLQVNLRHHPDAFANLDQAFDPLANARYAAQLLRRLHAAAGDWLRAAGHYHSQTPERAEAYRARVLAVWPGLPLHQAEQRQGQVERAALGGGWPALARAVAQRPVGRSGSGPQAVAPPRPVGWR